MTDKDLDMLFAAARTQDMRPSDALMSRVLADALAHQPEAPMIARPATGAAPVAAAARRRGFWAGLAAALGGAGAMAALGSAAAAGVVIGFSQPATLGVLTAGYYETAPDRVELLPSVDAFLTAEE